MTDGELAATVITASGLGGGGFVAFLKWAVGQWREERKLEREALQAQRGEDRADRREDRNVVAGVAKGVEDVQLTLTAMLERDRVRDERRKRASIAPHVPIEEIDDETTDVHEIKRELRERERVSRADTPPAGGVQLLRPRTHG